MRYGLLRLPLQKTTMPGMNLPRLTLGMSLRLAPLRMLVVTAILAAAGTVHGADEAPEAGAADEAAARYSEEEVKAAFLFHFATYAEWPPDEPHDEITFAILGASVIAEELERFAAGRRVHDRPVRIRRIRSLEELDQAEILFVGANEHRTLKELADAVDTPTLVVTDSPDGLPEGAMINFQLVERRVRFEIALTAVQRAGLTLSSRLLSAALRVEMTRCYLRCKVGEAEGLAVAAGYGPFRTPNPA